MANSLLLTNANSIALSPTVITLINYERLVGRFENVTDGDPVELNDGRVRGTLRYGPNSLIISDLSYHSPQEQIVPFFTITSKVQVVGTAG